MASILQNKFHDSFDDFNKTYNVNHDQCLRVFQWNVRGINDLEKFDNVLQSIQSVCVIIDIIVISETWLKEENTPIYRIPGYVAIFSSRKNSNGGLAIYVKQEIKHRIICNETIDGLHHTYIEIDLQKCCFDFHGIYRPPSFDFHRFNDMLENLLHTTKKNRSCFIVGDLNVPLNMINNNVVVKYRSLLESYGYICTNTFVTRPASKNILDHFVCKMDDANQVRNDTIFSSVSDHLPILSSINLKMKKTQVLRKSFKIYLSL